MEEVSRPDDGRPGARRAVRAGLGVAVTAALLTGCGAAGSDRAGGLDAVPAAATSTPDAAPTTTAASAAAPSPPDWRAALRAAADWTGTAHYDVRARDGRRATAAVARDGERIRVDVVTDGLVSTVLTTDTGWVACAGSGEDAGDAEDWTCLTVADAGADLPAAWDPGVGRLVAQTVPGLAARDTGIWGDGWIAGGSAADPADPADETAPCVEVVGEATGRYCVTESGLLRRAKFTGGVLALVSSTSTVDDGAFVPPAEPVDLD